MSNSITLDYQQLLRESSPDFEDHFNQMVNGDNQNSQNNLNPFATEEPSILDTINNNYNPWAEAPEPTLWEKILNKTPWKKEDPTIASHLVDNGLLPESMRPTPEPTTVEITKHHYYFGGGLLLLAVCGIIYRKRQKKKANYQNLETLDQVDDYFDRVEHQRNVPHPSSRSPLLAAAAKKHNNKSKKSVRKNASFMEETQDSNTTSYEEISVLKKVELIFLKSLDTFIDQLDKIPDFSKTHYQKSKDYINRKWEEAVLWAIDNDDEKREPRNPQLLPHENPLEDKNLSFADMSNLASNNSKDSNFKIDEHEITTVTTQNTNTNSENSDTTYNSCLRPSYWKNPRHGHERKIPNFKKSAYHSRKSNQNFQKHRQLTKELYRLAHDVSLAKSGGSSGNDGKSGEKGDFVTIEIDENL